MTDLSALRQVIFAVLVLAFGFEIGTLWIDAQWPFVAFESVILLAACVLLCFGLFREQARIHPVLSLPFSVAVLAQYNWSLTVRKPSGKQGNPFSSGSHTRARRCWRFM